MDPHFGPPIWTPKCGPSIWTPNMDSQLDPQYGPPIWTPNNLGRRFHGEIMGKYWVINGNAFGTTISWGNHGESMGNAFGTTKIGAAVDL
jgi:hypothetical protein